MDDEEIVRDARTANARGADLSGINIGGVDLSRPGQAEVDPEEGLLSANLRSDEDLGIPAIGDVTRVWFFGAYANGRRDFTGMEWPDVDLSGLELEDVDFSDSDLRRVKFTENVLKSVRFDRANLREADLSGALIYECSFDDAELPDVAMPRATVRGNSHFDRAWLIGANMQRSRVSDCSFVETDMGPSDRSRTRADDSEFVRVDFEGADVSGMSFASAQLLGCSGEPRRSAGADFTNCRYGPDPGGPPGPEAVPDPDPDGPTPD